MAVDVVRFHFTLAEGRLLSLNHNLKGTARQCYSATVL
jgi:hypothetical protein